MKGKLIDLSDIKQQLTNHEIDYFINKYTRVVCDKTYNC